MGNVRVVADRGGTMVRIESDLYVHEAYFPNNFFKKFRFSKIENDWPNLQAYLHNIFCKKFSLKNNIKSAKTLSLTEALNA